MDHVVGGWPGGAGAIPADQAGAFEAVIWMAGLVLVLILATATLAWFRGHLRRSRSASRTNFSLDDLRRMRDRGDLTAAEYERLRAAIIDDFGAASQAARKNGAA